METTSFWAEIKKFEDILASDPASYCFAPLADLYCRLGLFDDAVNVARRGLKMHPEYAAGHLALGRACQEKGAVEEARPALEYVVKVNPENATAQKILTQLYLDEGNPDAAKEALQVLVLLNPEDVEGRLMLEALDPVLPDSAAETTVAPAAGDEASDESSVWCEDIADTDDDFVEMLDEEKPQAPLPTPTLAELYVAQGFPEQALAVYRELLEADPENGELRRRCQELQGGVDNQRYEPATVVDQVEIPVEKVSNSSPEAGGGFGIRGDGNSNDEVILVLEKWLSSIGRGRHVRQNCN